MQFDRHINDRYLKKRSEGSYQQAIISIIIEGLI